jgi:hypothetical protein
MLQENLGTKFDVMSNFKPNAILAKVVEDLGKLGKDLTKQDHIIIVGGPGNSLDRYYYCGQVESGLSHWWFNPSQWKHCGQGNGFQ